MYSSPSQSTTQQKREYREIIRNEKTTKMGSTLFHKTINHQIKSAYQMNPIQLEDVRRSLVASGRKDEFMYFLMILLGGTLFRVDLKCVRLNWLMCT